MSAVDSLCRFEGGWPKPSLEPRETVGCFKCGLVLDNHDLPVVQLSGDAGRCPNCDPETGLLYRRAATAASREPGSAATKAGYRKVPHALIDHARTLGLRAPDLVLVAAIAREQRYGFAHAVYFSAEDFAARLPLSRATIHRTLRELQGRGLVERYDAPARSLGGAWQANRYSMAGLGRALDEAAVSAWRLCAQRDHTTAATSAQAEHTTPKLSAQPEHTTGPELCAHPATQGVQNGLEDNNNRDNVNFLITVEAPSASTEEGLATAEIPSTAMVSERPLRPSNVNGGDQGGRPANATAIRSVAADADTRPGHSSNGKRQSA